MGCVCPKFQGVDMNRFQMTYPNFHHESIHLHSLKRPHDGPGIRDGLSTSAGGRARPTGPGGASGSGADPLVRFGEREQVENGQRWL